MAEKKLPRGIAMTSNGYRVRMNIDGAQFHVGYYPTLSLAKLAREEALRQKILGTFVPARERARRAREKREADAARKVTVRQWSQEWMQALAQADPPRSPSTLTSYQSVLNAHVLEALGDTPLADVTADDVMACCVRAADGGTKPVVARNVRGVVRALFNAAISEGVGGVTENPAANLKIGNTSRHRDDDEIPTLKELNMIVAGMPTEYALAVELAAWCSLRVSEVIALQRRDFTGLDTERSAQLRVDRQWLSKGNPPQYGAPKDDSYRSVHIPAALVPKVKAQLDRCGPGAGALLFPSPVDPHRPISHNTLARRWEQARNPVHPGLSFHSLRHFGLTMYAQTGATQTEIMRRGGHRDADVAARYQHSSLERDREHTALLNAMLNPPKKKKGKK